MLDFSKLWDPKYLFGPNLFEFSRSDEIFFWISLSFIAAGIASKIFGIRNQPESPRRFLFGRLFGLFITTGLLVLLWVGARYENIPWLSTHIVALVVLLIWVIWLGFIGKYFVREHRRNQKFWEEERLKLKYLAKK